MAEDFMLATVGIWSSKIAMAVVRNGHILQRAISINDNL
jgi:hypothetical protein